ncbi:thymidylate synthase [Lactobacillus sp. DCY120]|uniref:thymidylate synthase n=1 Tax=Bombilactobacillus apium TaxID=2675299 RepID=A0A850QZA8_9LACO|nr:thymidylate synthase [Bombilactobacillus apium]NVY97174.1 thymidylate synthase [Bombilactobacillus apium]
MEIVGNTLDEVYVQAISNVMDNGVEVDPRGLLVKEIQGLHIKVNEPWKHVITNTGRNMDLRFAVGEFLWYLDKDNSLDRLLFYNKRYKNFSDDGSTLHGAYGPRIFRKSWAAAKRKLCSDIHSRQAVINIYDANIDLEKATKDVPCTLSMHFMIRNDKLQLFVNMRSNDLIWGFPYDTFSFTMFQELMAKEIGIKMGSYHHYINSAHIYKRHYEISQKIRKNLSESYGLNLELKYIDKSINAEYNLRKNRRYLNPSEKYLFPFFSEILNSELSDRTKDNKMFRNSVDSLPSRLSPLISWRN